MIIHTAAWQLSKTPMTCGHVLALRSGERTGWCTCCGQTVMAAKAA